MGTITGTDNSETLTGTSGDDTILGLGGNDILNGLSGHDILTGGSGADVLNGGDGSDIYRDTSANFNGDEITKLKIGDEVQLTDLDISHGSIGLAGNLISYNNNGVLGSITVDNVGPGRIVVRLMQGGGVDLRLQQDAHNDFNGDGRSDILWRNDNGTVSEWLGTRTGGFTDNVATAATGAAPNDWHVAGTGDFNGDGRVDILWRNDNGTITDWLGNGNGSFTDNYAQAGTGAAPNSWHVAGTGDFNGDGISDILWRNDSGFFGNWLGTTTGGFTDNIANGSGAVGNDWHIVGTGDFNGDGVDDLLWRNDNGTITDWLGSGSGSFIDNFAHAGTGAAPNSWHVVGTGDFNGDGLSDILWRNDNGFFGDWLGTASGGFTDNIANGTGAVGNDWHIVGTGDFNGDSIDDILWRNDSGTITDWLGAANGSFSDNFAHAGTGSAPNSWHVQDPFF